MFRRTVSQDYYLGKSTQIIIQKTDPQHYFLHDPDILHTLPPHRRSFEAMAAKRSLSPDFWFRQKCVMTLNKGLWIVRNDAKPGVQPVILLNCRDPLWTPLN